MTLNQNTRTDLLLERVRSGTSILSRSEQIELTARLAMPAILAQLSHIAMEYIDASMVGRLGAADSASIGLVATTTWLFWGLVGSVATGFSVQVAHRIGARDAAGARSVLRQALVVALGLSLTFGIIAAAISPALPHWLGGSDDICEGATTYFFIFAITLPFFEGTHLMSAMLRCSGNVKIPSMLNVMMCALDVLFNFLLIFPSHHFAIGSFTLTLPGAGLGIAGAALGTLLAEAVTAIALAYFLFVRSPHMRLWHRIGENTLGAFRPTGRVLKKALRIGAPIACERIIMCGAQITSTMIVAPLGTFAIAANSFGINAESLCYMPGYGIADAATTLVGQSIGAQRHDLARRFAVITIVMGIGIMTLMGALMYIGAPLMMGIMTPVPEIINLGVSALRIEAFAEPMFAASIVCYGVFVGMGDTLVPSAMNLVCIWVVRITLAVILAPIMGLDGVWLAMCIELNVRGILYLIRMRKLKKMNTLQP